MQNADKQIECVCNDAFELAAIELAAIEAHTCVSCRPRRRQARRTSLSAKELEAEYHVLSHDPMDDAYAMNGYLGQNTMIIPSELVIARLGYTPDVPDGAAPAWDPKALYRGILTCLKGLEFYPVAH